MLFTRLRQNVEVIVSAGVGYAPLTFCGFGKLGCRSGVEDSGGLGFVPLSRRAYLEVGSRPDSRDTFCYENHPWFSPCGPAYRLFKFVPDEFVRGQRKVSKRKATRIPP